MSIGTAKYVSLTTFRKDGSTKALPVWITELDDGRLGFTTSSHSWKVRRLQNDKRVELQPCDQRGRLTPGGEKVTGTAVASAEAFDEVDAAIRAKYGFGYHLIGLINRAARLIGRHQTSDTAVLITLG